MQKKLLWKKPKEIYTTALILAFDRFKRFQQRGPGAEMNSVD